MARSKSVADKKTVIVEEPFFEIINSEAANKRRMERRANDLKPKKGSFSFASFFVGIIAASVLAYGVFLWIV